MGVVGPLDRGKKRIADCAQDRPLDSARFSTHAYTSLVWVLSYLRGLRARLRSCIESLFMQPGLDHCAGARGTPVASVQRDRGQEDEIPADAYPPPDGPLRGVQHVGHNQAKAQRG